MKTAPESIIAFWRDTVGPARWFAEDKKLDADITRRFRPVWELARDGKLNAWEARADHALALLLVLDQFPRNMFRGKAEAFSSDAKARDVARRALAHGFDMLWPANMRGFFYLPFMHSEELADQDRCVALIAERLGTGAMNYPFALEHRDEIRRFGRFPRRNKALGRKSTEDERAFLSTIQPR
jgi:uncharacterized protein (DUF924 family)